MSSQEVTPSRPLSVFRLTVAQDYGQFYFADSRALPELRAMNDLPRLVGGAQDNNGIIQEDGVTVILVPHQNNFEMPLRCEVWDGEPPADLAEWQEGFEFSAAVDHQGLLFDSVDSGGADLDVPAGRYRCRIVGRGFVARGWPGSPTPGDEWRLQLWPDADEKPPIRIASWDGVRR